MSSHCTTENRSGTKKHSAVDSDDVPKHSVKRPPKVHDGSVLCLASTTGDLCLSGASDNVWSVGF